MRLEDMVDIKSMLGLPAKFNPKTLEIKYGKGVQRGKDWQKTLMANAMSGDALWKSLRFGQKYTDEKGKITQEPDLSVLGGKDRVLYSGQQGPYWDDPKYKEILVKNKLRPDVTIMPAGDLDGELMRTEGHHHLSLLPEVYQTVCGENGYLLFKTAGEGSEDIEDAMFVVAEAGDFVIFPPKYQHISINIGKKPFVMTDFVSTEANSDFNYIKRHNGAPYWIIKDDKSKLGFRFERNPRYKGKVPEIRIVRPVEEVPSFGLKKGKPIFNIVKEGDIDKLAFLNDTSERPEYKKAYVPFL